MNTWILVCDASRARIFRREPSGPWKLVRSVEHPESRLQDNELVEGQPGRQQQSFGKGSKSAMEPPTAPKEVEREAFANELVHILEHEYDLNSYSDLALVAPPHFLGLLRKSLGSKVSKRVVASFDKDYSQLPLKELQSRVDPLLDAAPSSSA